MIYADYVRMAEGASSAVEKQDFEAAMQLLNELIQSDLPDLDKSYMAINMAVVWTKQNNSIEALRWYDRAARYEKPFLRFFALEKKAAYLWGLGRNEEAADIYRDLIDKPFLLLNEKESLRATLKQLEG